MMGDAYGVAACFDPHPREAGDGMDADGFAALGVSIRSRVKRVTTVKGAIGSAACVSIRTRVKRVTKVLIDWLMPFCFDPHPREAGDFGGALWRVMVALFRSAPA